MALITTFKIDFEKSEIFSNVGDLRRLGANGMNRIFYTVDGLISRTNLFSSENNLSGSISIFVNREAMEIY